MVTAGIRFNTYLKMIPLLGLAVVPGCQTPEAKAKKQLSTLQVRLEAGSGGSEGNEQVAVGREMPMNFTVQKAYILCQNDVKAAKVVDVIGGFALRVQFDRRGTWLLEQYSANNIGKHFAIFSQFAEPPEEKLNKGRWLAAPRINQRIGNGVLTFTPDASREEAEQIAVGLNNLAKKLKKEKEPDSL